MTPTPPIPEDLQEKKSQAEIDVSNLQFYARMFREYKWGTDVISWTVFEQTLKEVAERIAKLTAEVERQERAVIYRGCLLEEALIYLEECDAWQLRGSIQKELERTSRAAIKEGQ